MLERCYKRVQFLEVYRRGLGERINSPPSDVVTLKSPIANSLVMLRKKAKAFHLPPSTSTRSPSLN